MKRAIIAVASVVVVLFASMFTISAVEQDKTVNARWRGCCPGCWMSTATGNVSADTAETSEKVGDRLGKLMCNCPWCMMACSAQMSGQMMMQCAVMMQTKIFSNSPAAILGQAQTLGLSEAQNQKLSEIEKQAREKALAVLTPEQQEKLGDVSVPPVSMASLCQKMCGKVMTGAGKDMPAQMMCPMMQWMTQSGDNQTQMPQQTIYPVMGGAINKNIGMNKVLKITWQRLVDEKGQTCQRCGSTGNELQKAYQSLEKSLSSLGVKVTLEKKALDPAICAKDISQSNRIWIGERTLEQWLGAQVGKSPCGFCCAELGDQVECRTVEVQGQVYEAIPAKLIIRAGLLAAADLYGQSEAKACCPEGSFVKTNVSPSCPVSCDRSKDSSNK
ncbi:MAG: DUF2703 domain-containing protein [Planctomycetota bacterium]|jgi:hypothetical protein